MSLVSVNDERLQRYFDGELPANERVALEQALAQPGHQSADLHARLVALGQLRNVIDHTLTAEADAADLDLWPALAARLDAADADAAAKKQTVVRRWRDRLRRSSMSTGLAIAAVAALLLVVRPWHPRHPENDCDVESLEVDGAMATVMSLSDAPHHGDGTTTIIFSGGLMRSGLRFVGASLLALASASTARADGQAAMCEVRVIHALHDNQGIDPQINKLRPYLEKPPFTAWGHFKLLDKAELTIERKKDGTFALPNGKQASLTYLDHFIADDGDHRLRLQFGIRDGAHQVLKTTFVLDEGGVVLQAGQKYQDGLLILGISCKTK